jgi:hypothetical protein
MRPANALADIPPHLIVMAIAEEAAREREHALRTSRKVDGTPAAARVERLVRLGDWRELVAAQLAHPERLRDDHFLRCEIQLARADENRPGFQPVDTSAAQRLALPLLPAKFSMRLLEDPTHAAPAQRRTLIPERYRRPWEFQMPRAEAIAHMNSEARPGWFERLKRFFSRRAAQRAIDRWQGQLEGKAPCDQLWGVRPPHCAFQQRAVKQWVSSTLARFGWDPVRGGREWEIFWRRKGV